MYNQTSKIIFTFCSITLIFLSLFHFTIASTIRSHSAGALTAQFIGNVNNISPFVTYDPNPAVTGNCVAGDYIKAFTLQSTTNSTFYASCSILDNTYTFSRALNDQYTNITNGPFELYIMSFTLNEVNTISLSSSNTTQAELDAFLVGRQFVKLSGVVHFPAFVTIDSSVALDTSNQPTISGTCEDESDIDITIKTGNLDPLLQTLQQSIPTFKCPANGRYSTAPNIPIPGGDYCIIVNLFDPVTGATILDINDNRAKATTCGVKAALPIVLMQSGGSVIIIGTQGLISSNNYNTNSLSSSSNSLNSSVTLLNNSQDTKKTKIKITDPFTCEKGIFGEVDYQGNETDLGQVRLTLKGNDKSYYKNLSLDSSGKYEFNPDIEQGLYKVKYEISDTFENQDSGEYEFYKPDCGVIVAQNLVGKGESTVRTGGF